MQEKRKAKRTVLEAKIMIKRLDNNGENRETTIDILDVSKNGVGFSCDEALSIGALYEAHLTLWTKEVLHSFVQIVRIEMLGTGFNYGGIFIGMSEMDASRIEVYQTVSDNVVEN